MKTLISTLIILILMPFQLVFSTVIPACVGGGNVEDGVEIDGGECGVLDDDIGTLSGSLEIKDVELTIDGDITTL